MDFKMRAETHYYQPKKVRNTTQFDQIRVYFSACIFSNAAMGNLWRFRTSSTHARGFALTPKPRMTYSEVISRLRWPVESAPSLTHNFHYI